MAEPLVEPSDDPVVAKALWWKDPIVVTGVALPSAILVAFFGYLVGTRRGPVTAPPAAALAPAETPKPTRNPKIPIELSYPVIEEHFNPPRSAPLFPGNRLVYIRLNMKVSEEVLREICLEMKAKETAQFEHTRIFFWLSGRGPGAGGGNAWASANFDQGLRVRIMGFTIKEEEFYRTHPLFLPKGSKSLGTWILDDGYMKTRDTIYRLGDRWLFHLQFTGTDNPEPIEMEALPAEKGRIFKMKTGSDLYVIDPNGELEVHNFDGKLISKFDKIIPPPPDR
jgi:hypothetical protein